jgi:TolB-like protein/Tfp pilus assembly protein PilF
MPSIWEELKRRNVVRVAAAYSIVGWLLVQVADTFLPALQLPEWTVTLVAVLVILGFPIALILSWAYELTPDGVERTESIRPSESVAAVTGRRLDYVITGVLAIAVVVLAVGWFESVEEPASSLLSSPDRRSIAVLPLDNLSPDPENAYFADGIHDDLLTQLARISSLKVVSRTSVLEYGDSPKNMREIGRELGVATLLEGGVRRMGNSVRINVQLIDAETDEHLWAETYDRVLSAENIFAIQREMAISIARELQATLSDDEISRLKMLPTQNTQAYDLYVRGRFFWNQRTEEGIERALSYYYQAIDNDPNYALAHAGIASSYILMGHELYSWRHPRDSYPKAQAAARRALELDDTLAEAHSVLGEGLLRYDWDFISADSEHQRAIALNPNYATGHQWYSHYLLPMGREKESLAHSLRALELDPLNLIINLHLGWHYFYVGENELAIEQLQQTLELNPNFIVANLFLGQVYEQEMRLEEAIAQFERAVDLSGKNPVHLAALAHAYGISGRQEDAELLLQELLSSEQYVPSYEIAVIYAGLDRQDEALTWLEKAYEEKDSTWLVDVALDPRFLKLRSAPRFENLTRRLGLP